MEKKIANIIFKPLLNSREEIIAYDAFPEEGYVLFRIDPDTPENENTWIKTKSIMVGNQYDFDNITDDIYDGVFVRVVGKLSIFTIKEEV